MTGDVRSGRCPSRGTWWQRALLLLPALCLVSGCKLIDQNTFAPAPEAKPVAAVQPAATPRMDTRRPLVIIDYSVPNPNYGELLRYAVNAAEARDRKVQYDVIAVVAHIDAAARAQRDAIGVMRAIMADGVPAGRIHLGLRVEPERSTRQVRVYVR